MKLKLPKPLVDVLITLIFWVYYILGFLLFFFPVYWVAFLFAKNREYAWQRLNHLFYRSFFRLVKSITPGLSIHIAEEVAPIRSAVIVSNHISYLDPILLISLYEKQKTIVKSSLFKLPVFGWLLDTSGYIPSILTESPKMIARIEGLGEYFSSGGNLFVFPEGTRSRNGRVGHFNKSAFKIAIKHKVPVYVLLIQNTDRLFSPDRFWFNSCIPNTIRVELVGRIDPSEQKVSVAKLAEEAKELLLSRLSP